MSVENEEKEPGAIINFQQVEKVGERLSSDKIAPVFKIKDTTPYEQKFKKLQKKRLAPKVEPPKKEKKKRKYNEDSSSDSMEELFKKDTMKNKVEVTRSMRSAAVVDKDQGEADKYFEQIKRNRELKELEKKNR